MLEAKIKILASIYTAILMVTIASLLLFGGFKSKPKLVKGTTIQATMVDISQLKPRKKPSTKTPAKKQSKPQEKKPEVKPAKKEPKIKTPKKTPPKVVKKTSKVDTKALERERKEQKELERKKEKLRKRKLENKKRLERAVQDLKDLANKAKDEDSKPVENIGSSKGTIEANKRNQLMARYQQSLLASVERQWNKPASAAANLLCHVKVKQIPGGGVIDASISSPCNANTIVRNSIIAAIKKADPLPYKGFESVFDRNATFIFQPRD